MSCTVKNPKIQPSLTHDVTNLEFHAMGKMSKWKQQKDQRQNEKH